MGWHHTKLGKFVIIIIGIIFVIILAVIDDLVHSGYNLSLFYVAPIVVISFFVGRWAAVYIALLSAVIWLVVDIRASIEVSPTIHLSNTLIRIGFFFFVTQGIFYLVRLRERQKEIVEFVVHDLKTPLTNINIALNSIIEKVGDTPNKLNQLAKVALVSSARMVTFINSLIDLSKIEDESYTNKLQQTDLRALVEGAVESVNLWAEKASIKIEKDIETKGNIFYTDPSLVERTLMNLLSNALKVSPSNSTISVRVEDGINKLIFCVSDQGPGLAKKWKNRPFDKYFQIEAKKQGMIVGSGIGLTFCQYAVKQLGGHIWFDSEPGLGTSVTFELPTVH
ncbi:MAG: HAMP domain-containing sensor histidine kinase [Pseudomonadota bacterium]